MLTIRLKYVHEDVDRHGNVRIYFRRGRGQTKTRLREKLGSEEFMRRYHALLAGTARADESRIQAATRPRPGTLRALFTDYFSSPQFSTGLDPRTQYVRRGLLEAICEEPLAPGAADRFGAMPVARFSTKAVRIIRDRKAATPESANARLKALRQVFAWAMTEERPGVTANPARAVAYIRSRSTGFHSWSIEEVERYEARHAVGTKARLALALLMYTGARRSDVIRFGRQHLRGGRLRFTAHKGRNRNPKFLDLPVLPELQTVLDASAACCGDLAFLVTTFNRPFTSNGFGNKMRAWCDEAGLPHCAAHGLRKAGAAIAAENGATELQLMAIFGWDTMKEAQRYTRAARRKELATKAMPLLVRAKKSAENEG